MKKSYSFMIITFLVMFFISINNVKAFEFTVGVTKYRDVVFGGKYQYAIPFPQANSSVEVKFDNLNHTIYCDTNYCGLNYFYTTTYLSNSSSTDTIQFYANSVGLDANGYPPCSVNGGSISCIVPNGLNIRGVSLYFSRTQGNVTTVIDSMLAGTYTVFNINDNNVSSITSAINTQSQQQHQDSQAINNSINNDNTSGAESSADDLKNNSAFQDNTGLSAIISMPLTFVNSLTNTCQPINLTIPYMDADVSIPCMQSVITNKMPLLANLIKIVINGFIVYRILLDIFQIVRNAKNPEDDRIEVLDL